MTTTMIEAPTTDARRDALQAKVDGILTDAAERFGPALETIEQTQDLLVDRVVPLGKGGRLSFGVDDSRLLMNIQNGHAETYTLHPHAAVQAGMKLGIPGGYIRDLSFGSEPWQRRLASQILNEHASNSGRERVLVRAVGDEVRGVLSDAYRRLDSGVIVRSFLKAGLEAGLRLYRAEAEDTQISVEMLLPMVFTVPLPNHGIEYSTWGARLRSSDFGDGAVSLSIFDLRCRCMNLAVMQSAIRQIHIGGRLPDDIQLSEQTYRYDTQTQAGIVSDAVRSLLSRDAIERRIAGMTEAAEEILDLDDAIKMLPKLGASKPETEGVRRVLAENSGDVVPEGPTTRYKLSQALSAVAQLGDSPARRRDLEELAGKLLMN